MAYKEELSELEKEASEIILDCVNFASEFLSKPESIEVGFSDFASGLFEHVNVPCFTTGDGKRIVFNLDWLKRSLPEHVDDVRFFVFHELRHVHQKFQILLHMNGLKTNESEDVIAKWQYGFAHYITNMGDNSTQEKNLLQVVEQDANAYALALLNLYHLGEKWEFEYSLPEEAFVVADARCQEYYKSKPELRRYIDKKRRMKTGINPVGKRPDAYSPCPCGSGKKFKFCCYKNGIYD